MKRRVRLFIGGLEVEFKTVPDILYNFKVDDITSPSAVKNSYSKTVTIPGTKQNNRIFDSFFLNDYKTQGTNFDATKKTEFTLYVDNEPYQTGYVRLDKVKQNKHYFEYDCTLYSTLGEFFYNLSYKDSAQGEDERMKLSDLDYFIDEYDETPQELGFQITKETVKEAWDEIDSYSSKWGTINFAPAYNGLPDDFDADKVLMNLYDGTTPNTGGTSGPVVRRTGRRDASIVSKVTSGGTTYTTYGGYAVAEMSREYTGAEMRDFRSYLQRPVVRVKKVIEAMCRPEANGGFQVELDPDWFYYDNCYWQDLWVTRPTLSSLEYVAKADDTGTTITKGTKTTQTITPSSTKDPGYEEKYNLNISGGVEDKPFDMRVNLNLKLGGVTAPTDKDLVLCAYYPSGGFTYPSAMLVQLVAYDAFGNPVAGSPVQYITSAYGIHREGRQVYTNFVEYSSWNYTQPYGNEYSKQAGNYFKYSGSTFQWDSNIQLDAKNIPAGSTVKVVVTELYKASGSPAGAKKLFYRYEQGGQQTTYTAYTFNDFDIEITDYKIAYQTSEGIRTGVEFTKKQLLDTDYSPADFLLSYMKIFGLYAICDNVQKKVSILTRHNFFKRDEIEDVQDLIDRSSVEITPLVFNSKWYDWNLEADESEYGKAYEDTYGKPYGRKKINTGYNFNKDTKEVLEGNIFKNAVQVLERSNAFCYIGEDTVLKSWMMPGYKYNLYATNDATDTYEVEVAASSTIDLYSGFTTGYLYYDMYDKVQLHSADNSPADGSNVLLIRTGNKSTEIGSIRIKYILSDDNSYMSILNDGRPCWLYSTLSGDSQGNSVCIFLDEIPYFSRYKVYTDSGYITRSLDFGKPDEIYIPGLYYRPGSTIYEEFWQDYISDLYNKDSRVMKCKMLIKEKPTVDWLRRFYVFDNAVWRMLSIEDYNAAVDKLTTVQFVRVQDISKYDSVVVSEQPTISITLSANEIGLTGGTVNFSVVVSDGGAWYVERYDYGTTVSITGGTGDMTGTWTIPANSSTSDLQRSIMVMADNASATATLTQKGVSLGISGPVETGDVPWTGGTRHFIVTSPDGPWTAQTPYTGIITNITPSAGTATTGTGVTVTATVGENQNTSTRQAYLTLIGPGGTLVRSGYLTQQATQGAEITVSPSYLNEFSFFGGSFNAEVFSTEDWRGYTTYPDRATISPTSGHSGITQVTVTVQPNFGDRRYMQLLFYRDGSPASNPASITVWQNAFEEGITVVPETVSGVSSTGGTINITVSSTQPWGASIYGSGVYSVSPFNGGSGVTNVVAIVSENGSVDPRSASIRFTDTSGNTATVSITQEGIDLSPYATQYLSITKNEGTSDNKEGIYFEGYTGSYAFTGNTFSYSKDNGNSWTEVYCCVNDNGVYKYPKIPLNSGETVLLKTTDLPPQGLFRSYVADSGNTGEQYSQDSTFEHRKQYSGETQFSIQGNIMSLVYGDNFIGQTTLSRNLYSLFGGLFITNALHLILPATNIEADGAYQSLFAGTPLIYPPYELPATSAGNSVYYSMFQNCKQLLRSPIIKLTSIPTTGCRQMFYGCTSIEKVYLPYAENVADASIYRILYNAASYGTLYKKSGETYTVGANYIPSTWSQEDY